MLAAASTAYATSDTWVGTSDALWATPANWATSPATVPGTGDTATFSESSIDTNGNTTIDLGSGVTIGALLFDSSNAAAYTIGSGAVGGQTLTLDTTGNAITVNSSVVQDQLFNANLALTVTRTASTPSTYYTVANNSATNTLTLAGGISASTAGVKVLNVAGSGNTTISGAITSGSGNMSLFKTGSGTLTLSGGGTFSGTGVTDGAAFASSAVFREGTTILDGGTYSNSAGELVIGGVATHGGAGTNTTLQLNNDTTLNGISWLSIGRGNGNGSVTSNLTLNGNALVTSSHLSAGFNAGNAGNTPKGAITLNNTSSLSISTAGEFHLGESAGSNYTMTLNDSSTVTINGTPSATSNIKRYIGGSGGGTGTLTLAGSGATFTDASTTALTVGLGNGTGTVNVNAGTFNHTNGELVVAGSMTNGTFSGTGTVNVGGGTLNTKSLTVGRNNDSVTSTLNGAVNVSAGTLNVTGGGSLIGWRGIGATGTLNVSGGTFNQGTTGAFNMDIGTSTGANGAVTVSSGALTFQNNSGLRFATSTGANASTRTLTISGGNVTFYSNAGTTVGGTGTIDLMTTANALGVNTINLNGGTLTANQIKATSATGTRVINFNGGTLKTASSGLAATFLASGVATTANVRNGGALFDTNGIDTTIGQSLVHSIIGGDNATDGGLTKNGSGTLTLSGANTYTGGTVVNAGTVAFANSFSMAGTNQISVAATGTAGTNYATVTSTIGTLTFGGTLGINLTASLSGGETFNLFQASGGALAGDFSGVSISGSYIASLTGNSGVWTGSGNGFDFSFASTSGILSITASTIPEPGTYAAIFAMLSLAGAVAHRRRKAPQA